MLEIRRSEPWVRLEKRKIKQFARSVFIKEKNVYICKPKTNSSFVHADVVKLVDTLDLGSCAARRGGSSPFIRTLTCKPQNIDEAQNISASYFRKHSFYQHFKSVVS